MRRQAARPLGAIVPGVRTTIRGTPDVVPAWLKYPDGRLKKMGEMSRDEQREQMRAACDRLQCEFDDPAIQEKIVHILVGGTVQ